MTASAGIGEHRPCIANPTRPVAQPRPTSLAIRRRCCTQARICMQTCRIGLRRRLQLPQSPHLHVLEAGFGFCCLSCSIVPLCSGVLGQPVQQHRTHTQACRATFFPAPCIYALPCPLFCPRIIVVHVGWRHLAVSCGRQDPFQLPSAMRKGGAAEDFSLCLAMTP